MSETDEYFYMLVSHMLHRIWELQAAQLIMSAETEADKAYVQEIIDNQQQGDYTMPFNW